MTAAKELLANLVRIMGPAEDWEKEVRFNSVRRFSQNLVFFATPENAPAFLEAVAPEFLMPKGIIAMTRALKNRELNDDEKITSIKKALLDRGYDGIKVGASWIRTERTHKVYDEAAKAIADYEYELTNLSSSTYSKFN